MFNSSAFSIMNRKHKTIVNKYTENCNKNYSRPMLRPVKEEKERGRRRECRERKEDAPQGPRHLCTCHCQTSFPPTECPPQHYPISVFLMPTYTSRILPWLLISPPPLWSPLRENLQMINDPFSKKALTLSSLSTKLSTTNQTLLFYSSFKLPK